MTATTTPQLATVDDWRSDVLRRIDDGARFAGLFASSDDSRLRLTAALAVPGTGMTLLDGVLGGAARYPSLTPQVPAAGWYERVAHDLTGVMPHGHPRLDPLLLPVEHGAARPRPGSAGAPTALVPREDLADAHVSGPGMFLLPYGPVRSGVVESVEYLLETPGEDIPHLRVRPYYKHRGLAKRFEELSVEGGVLLAERVEGVAGVAHALAYTQAVEALAGVVPPPAALLLRLVHAEVERVANHLDVAMRLADAAALAVATARFGWHKERMLRLRSQLCGSRYGRGVVAVGGVHRPLGLSAPEAAAALDSLERDVTGDARAVMGTASFLDRLRGTGPLSAAVARSHAALGPLGRASGAGDDVRATLPYGAYRELPVDVAGGCHAGDVQDRLQVRFFELHESFRLARRALARLADHEVSAETELRAALDVPDGRAAGWAEAPQGEVLYLVEVAGGRLRRVVPRSASFHNLPLFHRVFAGDIFTDFPFIEASFGLSIAGVSC